MKHLTHILLLVVAAMMLNGCYSTRQVSMENDYRHACMGLPREAVIQQFGQPARTYQIDKNEVLVYEKYVGEQTVANRQYLELTFNPRGVCTDIHSNYTKPERYYDKFKTGWCIGGSIVGGLVFIGGVTALGVTLGRPVK